MIFVCSNLCCSIDVTGILLLFPVLLHLLIEILLGGVVLSSSNIYLCQYWICIFTPSEDYNRILWLFTLLLRLSQHWTLRVPSSCFCVLSTCPCYLLSISLLSETTRCLGSFCIFLVQNQTFLQGALVSFMWESYLETKIWVLGTFPASGVSLPLGVPRAHN